MVYRTIKELHFGFLFIKKFESVLEINDLEQTRVYACFSKLYYAARIDGRSLEGVSNCSFFYGLQDAKNHMSLSFFVQELFKSLR